MMSEEPTGLALPYARCLTKQQAAEYLGIGTTLLTEIGPRPIKLGRRSVYDRVDLDTWLEDYKRRGRASKEELWPENEDSTDEKIHHTGGSTRPSRTEPEYLKVLGVPTVMTRKSA